MAAQVDDALALLALDLGPVHVPERAEQGRVEVETPLEVAEDEVEVVDRLHARRPGLRCV
ncbi:MAG: hypothetical protein ACXWZK_12550 [Solirubrobacterales bacterium]